MSPDYCGNHNSLAEVKNFRSYIITYCIFWTFISLLILPICVHFKDQINRFWTTLQLSGHFYCVWNYFAQVFHLFIGLYYIIKECRQLNVPNKETPQHLEVEQELPETSPPFITIYKINHRTIDTTFPNRRLITITGNSIPGIL